MASNLFYIRCDNCGAEYRINSRGEMNCPFCGSKIYLNDQDFKEYLKTRDEMLIKDRVDNDLVNSTGDVIHKWNNESSALLYAENGTPVDIKYFYQYDRPGKTVYVCREKVAIVYDNKLAAHSVINTIQQLQYPSADIKNLAQFFPELKFIMQLKDDKCLLVINKPENVYPLALFDKLDPKQVAWMISRMENFGCLLEYNALDTDKLEKLDLYINPKTHHMYLLGGWEHIQPKFAFDNYFLKSVRTIAKDLMYLDRAPQKCIDFLNSKPEIDAYSDFKAWDDVIEYGFSGHNFHPFTED